MNQASFAIVAAVLAVPMTVRAPRQVPTTETTPRPPIMVTADVQTLIRPPQFAASKLVGLVVINTIDKSLHVRWSYDGPAGRVFYNEAFDVGYWPTAAARLGDDRLSDGEDFVVAGKRSTNGHTVIERWDIQLTALPSATSHATVQKSLLYDANEPGRRVVRSMTPVQSVQKTVLVHFHDSGDLYRMNGETGLLSLLVTPSMVPSLSQASIRYWSSGKLAGDVYVYIDQARFSESDDGLVVFRDDDGDGTPDTWTEYSQAQWPTVETLIESFVEHFD